MRSRCTQAAVCLDRTTANCRYCIPRYWPCIFRGPALITGHIGAHTDSSTYGPAFAAATLSFGIAQMISPQIAVHRRRNRQLHIGVCAVSHDPMVVRQQQVAFPDTARSASALRSAVVKWCQSLVSCCPILGSNHFLVGLSNGSERKSVNKLDGLWRVDRTLRSRTSARNSSGSH